MKAIWDVMWERLKIISAIVGDVEANVIATVFYFTILVPFGILARLFTDPLKRNPTQGSHWQERHPVPSDLEIAKRQG